MKFLIAFLIILLSGCTQIAPIELDLGSSFSGAGSGGIEYMTSNAGVRFSAFSAGNYMPIASAGGVLQTAELMVACTMPFDGTFRGMTMEAATVQAGATSITIALRQDTGGGYSDTAISCTLGMGETECEDYDDVDFSEGDEMVAHITTSGIITTTFVKYAFLYASDDGGWFICGGNSATMGAGAIFYMPMDGRYDIADQAEQSGQTYATTISGTLKNFYATLDGVSGFSDRDITVRWNRDGDGIGESTSITCNIGTLQSTCSDVSNTQVINSTTTDELFGVMHDANLGATARPMRYSIEFLPDRPGEYFLSQHPRDNLLENTEEFHPISGSLPLYSTAEDAHTSGVIGRGKLKRFRVFQLFQGTACTNGTYTARKNKADTELVAGCGGNADYCEDTPTGQLFFRNGDLWSISGQGSGLCAPGSGPTYFSALELELPTRRRWNN